MAPDWSTLPALLYVYDRTSAPVVELRRFDAPETVYVLALVPVCVRRLPFASYV